ncbi:hypothetical protein DFH08DRAFT_836905 [Mycena albidolilacea]|uniref:Uncharacterized protein n=1 Tax=Mycena albidolilacea TaxID=1033008 RepID=A0AAD7ASM8_9AGAR|nr:hypothetical protein DFH08DRAFT_836905 [Mycena albidolilacea]
MAQAPEKVRPLPRLPSIAETEESIFRSDGASLVSDSQRTYTDTSTVWGPGTVSGRALLALGEATIRGIDALLIRRRLANIRLRVPFLTGSVCNDLLELCRPDMYSVRIAKQALGLTLTQICSGPESSVYLFVVSLCKWSRQEARFILLALVRSLREITPPPEWQLERLYDLMVAIIQVQDRWRSFVVEAAVLLDKPSFTTITHPIHLLSAEATADLPASPLSNLQEAYSPHMRSKAWLSLQACGLSLQDRVLKIGEILSVGNHASTARIVDALADVLIVLGHSRSHFDPDIRSHVLACFQSITTASELHSVRNQSELSALANFVWEATTSLYAADVSNSIHAPIFLRSTLCRSGVPQDFVNAMARKILGEIWGSDDDRIRCALSISRLSKNEIAEILKILLTNEQLSICKTIPFNVLAAEQLCEFLAIICQITGEYISRDVAWELSSFPIRHRVITIASQIIEEKEVTPLSKLRTVSGLETNDRRDLVRLKTWTVLQTHGLRLESQVLQIQKILSGKPKVSNHQIFDAVVDASFFTRECFSLELRCSAFDCLLKYALTPTLEQMELYNILEDYSGFYRELERRTVMRELPMDKLYNVATLLSMRDPDHVHWTVEKQGEYIV